MATLNVGPGQTYATIAAAMAAANPGDTIQLAAGYVNETATVTKNNITVSGAAGNTGIILTLNGSVSGVTLAGAAPIAVNGTAAGAETITGNSGANTVTLLAGTSASNTSFDTVVLGGGDDTLILNYGTLVSRGIDMLAGTLLGDGLSMTVRLADNGGSNVDRLVFSGVNRLQVTGGSAQDYLRGSAGDDVLSGGGSLDYLVDLLGGVGDVLNGGDGDDQITKSGVNSAGTLNGDAGNDMLDAGGSDGADILNGGADNDTLIVGLGADQVNGGTGNDALGGSLSAETRAILISAGVDTTLIDGKTIASIERFSDFTTGSGDDVITTSANVALADTLSTGEGADTVTVLGGATASGTGLDTVDLGGGASDTLILSFGAATDAVVNTAAGLTMAFSSRVAFSGAETVTLTSGAGADSLSGFAGTWTLNAGEGNDTLALGTGPTQANGGGGDDGLVANLSAATEALTLSAGTDAAVLPGGHSFTSIERFANLTTGSGGDVVVGALNGALADTINTGLGDDTVTVTGGATAATTGADIVDLGAGGADTLIINFSAATAAVNTTATVVQIGGATRLTYSNAETVTLTAGSAADTLSGFAGSWTLNGGEGNDTLTLGTGATQANGGGGDDALIADLSAATVALTLAAGTDASALPGGSGFTSIERFANLTTGSGNDVITTSVNVALVDVVNAGGGDDTVTVLGGATASGTGADTVNLGADGADTLIVDYSAATQAVSNLDTSVRIGGSARLSFSNAEAVTITGGSAADALVGYAGTWTLNGGEENDTLTLGTGATAANGGAGDDALVANLGAATEAVTLSAGVDASGLPGGHAVTSVERFQSLTTGSGADVIATSLNAALADVVNTGEGDDTVTIIGGATSALTALDQVTMGGGFDTAVINYAAATANVFVQPTRVEIGNQQRLTLSGAERFVVTTGSGGDYLQGAGNDDELNGGAGDDILVAGAGRDRVDGGTGTDALSADWGAETSAFTIAAGVNAPTLVGGRSVVGVERFNYLRTGSGADTITTSLDRTLTDEIDAGAGADTVTFLGGATAALTALDRVDLGADEDLLIIDLGAATQGVVMTNIDDANRDVTLGGLLALTAANAERVQATSGSANDDLAGGAGADVLNGGLGDDILRTGAGADKVDGGGGLDSLFTDWSGETLGLTIAAGVDSTTVGGGREVRGIERFGDLRTGLGNDVITTSLDATLADVVDAGGGDDLVTVLGGVNSGVTGTDTIALGAGNDRLVVDYSAATEQVTMTTPTLATGGAFGQITLEGLVRVSYSGADAVTMIGGSAGDYLKGGLGADDLRGGGGDDVLRIGVGADRADGGEGVDALEADFSADTAAIVLSAGVDAPTLAGGRAVLGMERFASLRTGSGADVIVTSLDAELADVIDTGGANDQVTVLGGQTSGATGRDQVELGAGVDTLVINYASATDAVVMSAPTFTANGAGGQLRLGGGVRLTYGGADVVRVTSGSASDTLYGGAGNDELNGGAGDDVISGGAGDDVIYGGYGVDIVRVNALSTQVSLSINGTAVVISGPDGTDRLIGVERIIFNDRAIERDAADGVDDIFYLANNPDVFATGQDADQHFQLGGKAENRAPNALFDPNYYLSSNPDLATAGVNAFDHFMTVGWREGRNPSAGFNIAGYLEANPDVVGSGLNPLTHYLSIGLPAGRSRLSLFDERGYVDFYTDVASNGIDPLTHYLTQGWKEGRDPSVRFDTGTYLDANPDVAASGVNPLLHWLLTGRYEGRPGLLDDGVWG